MAKSLWGVLIVLAALVLPTRDLHAAATRSLTLDERIAAQRAIEEVYWRHRIWPTDNPTPKPPLDATMPASAIRAKVEDYLKKSNALEAWWQRPITGDQLQAELDRIAHGSRDSRMLKELFDALGNDPMLIAETLARPALVERLARNWFAADERLNGARKATFDAWWKLERAKQSTEVARATAAFTVPALDPAGCTNDTWSPTLTDVPDHRLLHTTVWTGTEMIVWGGSAGGYELNTGGRYSPATDTWTPTSTGTNVPLAAYRHTAVWTGTEMIVWGGGHTDPITGVWARPNSGARYDPANDSWAPTSTGVNVPTGREGHSVVWTGTEMIVWGGYPSPAPLSGGRYNPVTNGWTTISAGANAPFAYYDKAVWTGTEMIVWANPGGRYNPVTDAWSPMATSASVPYRRDYSAVWAGTEVIVWGGNTNSGPNAYLNTGGRYNPSTDTWTATSTGANVPSPRSEHTAVWTGSKMIVWGGSGPGYLNDGAAYNPSSNSWVTLASNTLQPRIGHSAIWTGTEMIVWGGGEFGSDDASYGFNTGGRYNPTSDSWVATSMGATVPIARLAHTAVWTGTEMIVWGGQTVGFPPRAMAGLNSGGRYTPATDSWVPTSVGSGVPEARTYHSAEWTGKEMIVWGGLGADWLNTGGRYNPITDSWSATSIGVNAPPALQRHQNVWTGHEMIVWGLLVWNDPSTATGGRYDPATDSWRTMAPGTVVPEQFWTPVVWTGHEMLVWGDGYGNTGRYNPTTDTWAALSTGPNAPGTYPGYVNVWTGSEMIVSGAQSTTGGRYSPVSDSWIPTSTGANVPSPRSLAAAVWTGSEMLVWGGGGNSNPATVGGRYNPTTNSWLPMSMRPNAPFPVEIFHRAVWTGTEMIVWGGMPGTSAGGRYCACPSGRLVYRDADGDGYGDPGVSTGSCDGSAPAGYVVDFTDCNDASASAHPTAVEACNGFDDDCDGLVDESAFGVDVDGDLIHDACDNCRLAFNATQSDFDHDGQGDACDVNDGLIYEWRNDKTSVSWQAEVGPTSWNVYIGDLAVLRATGTYTQLPGANPLAARQCGVVTTSAADFGVPTAGKVSFSLVTGVTSGVEGSLGSATSGPRTNANPCP